MIRRIAPFAAIALLGGCFSQPPAPAVDRSSTPVARATPPLAQPSGPGYYTVKRGENLYRIGLDLGQDYRDIAAWNGIALPDALIKEGQVLRVMPPTTAADTGATVAKPVTTAPVVESRSLDAPPTVVAPAVASNGNVKREPRVGKEPYSDEAYARLNRPPEAVVAKAPELKAAEPKPAEVKPEPPPPAAGPDDVNWAWPTNAKLISPYSESGSKGLDFSGKAGDPVLSAGDGKVVYAGSGLRGYGELVIVKHNATFLSAYAHNRKILVKEGQTVSRGQKIAEMGNTDADSVKLHFEIRKQGKPVDPAQYLPKR